MTWRYVPISVIPPLRSNARRDASQKYKSASKAPLLINSCEIDMMFPADAQAATDKILGGGAFAPGYERTYWEGCTHGFSVRGDLVSRLCCIRASLANTLDPLTE